MDTLYLLSTEEACRKLEENHNLKYRPSTLRKLRCVGGGPRYRLLNRRPFYTESDLAAWVEEHLSEPRGHSSD